MVVKREISRKDGSSAWKVNSAPVPLERVKTEMKNLGVQLDNLCQFLPQARGLWRTRGLCRTDV